MHDAQLEAVNMMLSPFDLTTPSARECERLLATSYRGRAYVIRGKLHSLVNISIEHRQRLKQMKELEWLEAFLEDSDAQARCPPAKLQNITEHVYRRYNEVKHDVSDEARIIGGKLYHCLDILHSLAFKNVVQGLQRVSERQQGRVFYLDQQQHYSRSSSAEHPRLSAYV